MHTSTRRARRAIAILALAGCVTTAGAAVGGNPASADGHPPRVTVRVRHRTLVVDGGSADDLLTLRSPATAPNLVTVDLGDDGSVDGSADRATFDAVVVRAGHGNDVVRIDETAGVAVPFSDTIPTSLRGDAGDDTLLGGSGSEEMRGGSGDDVVDGNRGTDVATLDSGDDEFIWDPGDGSDAIEGRGGEDVMTFNGAVGAEIFTATASGSRLRFTRNVGNIVMDTDGVERVDVNALGGGDQVVVNDLAGTDVTAFLADLGAVIGSEGGDSADDVVTVFGTPGNDAISVAGADGAVQVGGLATSVDLRDVEPTDTLAIVGNGGDDTVNSAGLAPGTIQLGVS